MEYKIELSQEDGRVVSGKVLLLPEDPATPADFQFLTIHGRRRGGWGCISICDRDASTDYAELGDALEAELYDVFQTNDLLKDGDTITYEGEFASKKLIFACRGVHVVWENR